MHQISRIIAFLFLALSLTACRSEADKMAEFCLKFDAQVQASSDCHDMSQRLQQLLSPPQPRLHDDAICLQTTACRPCKKAVRDMLRQCGYDENLKPVRDQMHFSDALKTLNSQEDAP